MTTPTRKYYGQPDPIDGTPLYWRAHPDGIPIRQGDAPNIITKEQLNHAGHKLYARSKIYKIPDEIEAYNATIDWIANSGSILRFEEKQSDGQGKWVIFISWIDIRGYIPNNPAHTNSDVVGQIPRK